MSRKLSILDKNHLNKLSIFKNAYIICHSGYLRVDDKTHDTIYYKVQDPESNKDHQVTLKYESQFKIVKIMCDCTIQSLKIKHLPLCSHMLAVINRAVIDLGRPKRR